MVLLHLQVRPTHPPHYSSCMLYLSLSLHFQVIHRSIKVMFIKHRWVNAIINCSEKSRYPIVFLLITISVIQSYKVHWYLVGVCYEGYYCNHTSTVPDQYICPSGHYCPVGTGTPYSCPEGTFSSTEGNNHITDCLNCTAGYYCEGMNILFYVRYYLDLSTCMLAK